jgi:uncharacterized membrane protein
MVKTPILFALAEALPTTCLTLSAASFLAFLAPRAYRAMPWAVLPSFLTVFPANSYVFVLNARTIR